MTDEQKLKRLLTFVGQVAHHKPMGTYSYEADMLLHHLGEQRYIAPCEHCGGRPSGVRKMIGLADAWLCDPCAKELGYE